MGKKATKVTYFFKTADLGGGEKWTINVLNEMRQTKTWGKEYLDLTMVLCSSNEISALIDEFGCARWQSGYFT